MKPNSVLKKPIKIVYGGDADFLSSSLSPPTLTQASLKSLARPMVMLQARGRGHARALSAIERGRHA